MGNRKGKFGQLHSHSHSHTNRTLTLPTHSSQRDGSPYYPGISTNIMHLMFIGPCIVLIVE